MEWYEITNIDNIDSPALVVYPDRVRHNIRTALSMVGGDPARFRPHVKTHKSPDVTRLLMEAGIHKFKCATIAEAEMLAACGARDVLLAYQPIGPKVERFIWLVKQYPNTTFSCLFDNPEAAEAMDRAFKAARLSIHGYLDLNLGMNRTGILPGPIAASLYQCYERSSTGLWAAGLHAYDGHIRDIDFDQRKQRCDEAFALASELQSQLTASSGQSPVIVAGGSPTFSIHCRRLQTGGRRVECSPGTFVYWDKGYVDQCPEQNFLPAALVVARVVSLPGDTRICIDLGHKSVAAENELARRVFFLNTPVPLKPVGQSEEHLILEKADAAHQFRTGDVLYGLPFHICPTVALYERALTVENGRFTGEWKNVARDRRLRV